MRKRKRGASKVDGLSCSLVVFDPLILVVVLSFCFFVDPLDTSHARYIVADYWQKNTKNVLRRSSPFQKASMILRASGEEKEV